MWRTYVASVSNQKIQEGTRKMTLCECGHNKSQHYDWGCYECEEISRHNFKSRKEAIEKWKMEIPKSE